MVESSVVIKAVEVPAPVPSPLLLPDSIAGVEGFTTTGYGSV